MTKRPHNHDVAIKALLVAEQIRMAAHPDGARWVQAWRARERWFDRWNRWGAGLYATLQDRMDLHGMIVEAQRLQRPATKTRFRRAAPPPPPDWRKLLDQFGLTDPQGFTSGALASYLQLALDTGHDAGQFTLDALGINRTFGWSNPRNIAQALYANHGSKVLLNSIGQHQEQLAKMVIEATNPKNVATIDQLVKEIRGEWQTLERWQAERIARTETAYIWETTNYNVMAANGIESYEVLLASGPSIGIDNYGACDYCISMSSAGTYSIDDTASYPPYHPNCRCTAIPVLTNEDGSYWLPPADPYTGGDFSDPVPLDNAIRGE